MDYPAARSCLASADTEIVINTHISGRGLIVLWVLGMAMFEPVLLTALFSVD